MTTQPDASKPTVRIDVQEHVATLTLSDPARRNAMSPELGVAFRDAVAAVRVAPDVRAVVVTGAGGAFSGGGDLKMLEQFRAMEFETARLFMLEFYARFLCIADLEVPTIAAVQGSAVGAGLCLAMACDLCIVDQDAKLGLNFVQLGIPPGMGASYLAPRRVGALRAAELLYTGRRFDGREAAAMGLALQALPCGDVPGAAWTLARQIATGAPLAVRGVKAQIGLDRAALQRALESEAPRQAASYATADLGEGLAAVVARRAPVFRGE